MASLFRTPAAARMLSTAAVPRSIIKVGTPLFQQGAMMGRRVNMNITGNAQVNGGMNVASRVGVAAFHTTKKMQIFPAPPQVIQGTVNDPAAVPDPSPVHGSYHWSFERLVALGLVPLTLTPFVTGSLNPITDAVLAALLVIHSHIGFQSCVIDYFPKHQMPKIRKFMDWLLNATSALVLLGLYEFETNDVGITEAIKRIWKA